ASVVVLLSQRGEAFLPFFFYLSTITLAAGLMLYGLRFLGYRLRRLDVATTAADAPTQFSLRNLFLATTFIAVVPGFGPAIIDTRAGAMIIYPAVAAGVSALPVALGTCLTSWAVLSHRRAAIKLLFVTVITAGGIGIMLWLSSTGRPHDA